jgi:hypothetical protein
MGEKVAETRFTIQFSRTDPAHLQVAEVLNRQGRRSKAQYLVNAVLYYENGGGTQMLRPAVPDEKAIEAVVNRILRDREGFSVDKQPVPMPVSPAKLPAQTAEEIGYDEALEALGDDGINAVVGVMAMFRKTPS